MSSRILAQESASSSSSVASVAKPRALVCYDFSFLRSHPPLRFVRPFAVESTSNSACYFPPADTVRQLGTLRLLKRLQLRQSGIIVQARSSARWAVRQAARAEMTCLTSQGQRTLARRVFRRVAGVVYSNSSCVSVASFTADYLDRFKPYCHLSDRRVFPGGRPVICIRLHQQDENTVFEVVPSHTPRSHSFSSSSLLLPSVPSPSPSSVSSSSFLSSTNSHPPVPRAERSAKRAERLARRTERNEKTASSLDSHKRRRFSSSADQPTKRAKLSLGEDSASAASIRDRFKSRVCPNTFYYRYCDGPRRSGPWTEEEKRTFWRQYAEYDTTAPIQWGLFSRGVPGRNGAQCYAFYQRSRRSSSAIFVGSLAEPPQDDDDEIASVSASMDEDQAEEGSGTAAAGSEIDESAEDEAMEPEDEGEYDDLDPVEKDDEDEELGAIASPSHEPISSYRTRRLGTAIASRRSLRLAPRSLRPRLRSAVL